VPPPVLTRRPVPQHSAAVDAAVSLVEDDRGIVHDVADEAAGVALERALLHDRPAGVAVGAGEHQRAATRLDQVAGAGHHARVNAGVSLVEDHRGAIQDVADQAAGVASKNATGDRCSADVAVDAREDQRSRILLHQAAGARHRCGDRSRHVRVDPDDGVRLGEVQHAASEMVAVRSKLQPDERNRTFNRHGSGRRLEDTELAAPPAPRRAVHVRPVAGGCGPDWRSAVSGPELRGAVDAAADDQVHLPTSGLNRCRLAIRERAGLESVVDECPAVGHEPVDAEPESTGIRDGEHAIEGQAGPHEESVVGPTGHDPGGAQHVVQHRRGRQAKRPHGQGAARARTKREGCTGPERDGAGDHAASAECRSGGHGHIGVRERPVHEQRTCLHRRAA
jgi:hypothetical protein